MKESVTKFDLDAAFKALDDIDVPASEKGIKANRPALTEIFSQKTKFESLFEDYYDVGNQEELSDAKEAREAEVAKAKLARIEKIVDLDADSPEDLLTSYVGKYIVQCPQCMTLFYKNQEDVVESEEDKTTVNVGEICQHCGNESGYTLIGKVGEAEPEETAEVTDETTAEEVPVEDTPEEETAEETAEEPAVEDDLGDLDFDLDLEEPAEEEKTEESFTAYEGDLLVETLTEGSEDLVAQLKNEREAIATQEKEMRDVYNTFLNRIKAYNSGTDSYRKFMDRIYQGKFLNDSQGEADRYLQKLQALNARIKELDKCISNNGTSKLDDLKVETTVDESLSALTEGISDDKELDAKLDAHNEYIAYLRNAISDEEKELEKSDNEQVKAAIQRRIDAFKADLEAALPDEVKNSIESEEVVEEPVEATAEESVEEESTEEANTEEVSEEPVEEALDIYGNVLTEALHEEVDLEVSPDEFKKLLDSPEFKKPISDVAAKAMLNAGEKNEEKVEEDISLDEGIGDFFKAIGRKVFKNRAERADWVLTMARKDFNKIELDAKGNVVKDNPDNQKFKAYAVYYFSNKDKNGKELEKLPDQNEYGKLVPAKAPSFAQEYKKVEDAAIGWSKTMGNGPALIFLTEKKADQNKVFLCGYFGGKIVNDKLEDYYKSVYASLEGMQKQAKGAGSTNASELNFKDMKASTIRANMQVKIGNETGTVTDVKESRDKKNFILTIKYANGESEPYTISKNGKIKAAQVIEGLDSVMKGLEELNETVLEKSISKSLVEAYSNVTGFKLTGCDYVNDKLIVEGTASFASGNTRRLAYTFTEAFNNEGKVELQGLNEKLGADKKFTLSGKIENKTLITESFKCNK